MALLPTTLLYKASLTLDQLASEASTDEAAIGSLSALGHTATSSAATFTPGHVPADPFVLVDAAAPAPDGKTKICDGYVWNAGHPAFIAAYR